VFCGRCGWCGRSIWRRRLGSGCSRRAARDAWFGWHDRRFQFVHPLETLDPALEILAALALALRRFRRFATPSASMLRRALRKACRRYDHHQTD
jgi:hypothetical protein